MTTSRTEPGERSGTPSSDHSDMRGVEQLYRSHARFSARVLTHLGVAEEQLNDAVQQVFLIAHREGDKRPVGATERSWLGAIAMGVAAEARRTYLRSRRSTFARSGTHLASPHPAASEPGPRGRVANALQSLGPQHRAIFVLYELEREDCPAIAAALGAPLEATRAQLLEARERFVRAIEGVSSPGMNGSTLAG